MTKDRLARRDWRREQKFPSRTEAQPEPAAPGRERSLPGPLRSGLKPHRHSDPATGIIKCLICGREKVFPGDIEMDPEEEEDPEEEDPAAAEYIELPAPVESPA
jgi:hypothetical protein